MRHKIVFNHFLDCSEILSALQFVNFLEKRAFACAGEVLRWTVGSVDRRVEFAILSQYLEVLLHCLNEVGSQRSFQLLWEQFQKILPKICSQYFLKQIFGALHFIDEFDVDVWKAERVYVFLFFLFLCFVRTNIAFQTQSCLSRSQSWTVTLIVLH
jgi:hypothetical protein